MPLSPAPFTGLCLLARSIHGRAVSGGWQRIVVKLTPMGTTPSKLLNMHSETAVSTGLSLRSLYEAKFNIFSALQRLCTLSALGSPSTAVFNRVYLLVRSFAARSTTWLTPNLNQSEVHPTERWVKASENHSKFTYASARPRAYAWIIVSSLRAYLCASNQNESLPHVRFFFRTCPDGFVSLSGGSVSRSSDSICSICFRAAAVSMGSISSPAISK